MNSRDIVKDVLEGRAHGRILYEINNRVVTVAAAGAGVGFGTLVLGNLPVGSLFISQAKAALKFVTTDTDLIATYSGNFALGSAADADGSFAGNEANIIPSTAIGPAVARATAAATGRLAAAFQLDNTGGTLRLNLNVNINSADITDAQSAPLTVNGTVILMLGVLP